MGDEGVPGPAGPPAGVKSAERVLAILAWVSERGAVRFQDVVDEFGLARSSAHGLLRTLADRGWLQHDPQHRTWSLGLRAWQVGQRYRGNRDLAGLAQPLMDDLVASVGETVQLARLDGLENVYLAISESPHPMRLASSVGARLHAHATALGKALLAQLPRDEVARRLEGAVLPRFTDRTITDPAALLAAVDGARAAGHAQDEGEYLLGTRCVAVPVLDDGAGLVVAISITAPSSRTGADWPLCHVDRLHTAADRIRARTGLPAASRPSTASVTVP